MVERKSGKKRRVSSADENEEEPIGRPLLRKSVRKTRQTDEQEDHASDNGSDLEVADHRAEEVALLKSGLPQLRAQRNNDVPNIDPAKASRLKDRGVVYISRLPQSFVEPQLQKFFSQFGEISRLRLIRSKRTAESKGYAFIEFVYHDVAKVVAEAVNGYIMFGRTLRAQCIPAADVHPTLFTKYVRFPKRNHSVDAARLCHGSRWNKAYAESEEADAKIVAARIARRQKKQLEKLHKLGIRYMPPTVTRRASKKNARVVA